MIEEIERCKPWIEAALEYGEPHIEYGDGWIGEDCEFWTSKIVYDN